MRTLALLILGTLLSAGESIAPTCLQPPLTTHDNPYLEALVQGYQSAMEREVSVPDGATDAARRGSTRDGADRLRAALWLWANPASPLRGQVAVREDLTRQVRRIVTDLQQAGDDLRHPALDAFALASSLPTLVEVRRVVPDLEAEAVEGELRRLADLLGTAHQATPPRWINVDLALAVAFEALGTYLQRPELQANARSWAEGAAQHMYPDGAVAYFGSQNECTHYHDMDTLFLARLLRQTGDPWYRSLLARTAWYGPVTSSHGSEFWTVPSWKAGWAATGDTYGAESVVAIADLPVLTDMRDRDLARRLTSGELRRRWPKVLDQLTWYRRDLQPGQPLPNHYTAPDRNIDGPRAWYGRFSYAASLRPIPSDEPGLPTLMGVQMLDDQGQRGQFTRSLAPRVRLEEAPDTGDGVWNARALASAWLTNDLRPAQVVGRTWSVIAGSYALHRPASSQRGAVSAWRGRQVWIGLPDRVVGVLDIAGPADAPALGLETVLALGSTTPTTLEDLGKGRYRYGALAVRIHATDLPHITVVPTPFRNWKHPVTDLRLQEDLPGKAPTALRRRAVVELGPADAADDVQVTVEDLDAATVHLRVTQGARTLDAWHRDAPGETVITPTPESHRMQAGQPAVPATPLTIAQDQLAVTVSSTEAEDLQQGWASLADLLAHRAKP